MDDGLDVSGSGINFNFGAIVRPVPFMTFGVSYTSPSFVSMDTEGFLDFEALWEEGSTFTEIIDTDTTVVDLASIDPYASDLILSEYRLRTPSRFALGTTFFVGKSGFITGDLEFVNHAGSSINFDGSSATGENQLISELFRNVVNVRVGGEYRLSNFRLRAGYSFLPSPYQFGSAMEQSIVTFGIGYRTEDYFLDLAAVNRSTTLEATPYNIFENQPVATSNFDQTTVSFTLGFNF